MLENKYNINVTKIVTSVCVAATLIVACIFATRCLAKYLESK